MVLLLVMVLGCVLVLYVFRIWLFAGWFSCYFNYIAQFAALI